MGKRGFMIATRWVAGLLILALVAANMPNTKQRCFEINFHYTPEDPAALEPSVMCR